MSDTPLVKKLLIRAEQHVAILNAPTGYAAQLGALPEGVQVKDRPDGQFDVVQLFVTSKAELNDHAPTAIRAVKPGGILWICYPKKSSKIKTDLSRDVGWDVVHKVGWEGVTLISVDDVWSAMRFRPTQDVGKPRR